MSGDGLALQSPVQVSQEAGLNAKAGLGGSGHLGTGGHLRFRNFCLRESGAVVAFGARGRRSFLP